MTAPFDGIETAVLLAASPAPALDKPSLEALDIFARAADEIERRGWCRGTLEDEGRVCVLGAYTEAMAHPNYMAMWRSFSRALGFEGTDELVAWHDADDRTVNEVVDRLRRASRGEWSAR